MTTTPIQMRFADVDMLGHVNNVNQQHYFDVGKSDFFAQVLDPAPNWKQEGLITVSTYNDYLAQIRYEPASSLVLQFHRMYCRDSAQIITPFVRVGTYPTRNFATLGPL